MSLLLEALRRSEQRPLTLAPTEPDRYAPAAEQDASAVAQDASSLALEPALSRPAATSTARGAAQAMVNASAVPRAHKRRLVLGAGVAAGILLGVASWLGWIYWQQHAGKRTAVWAAPAAPSVRTAPLPVGTSPLPAAAHIPNGTGDTPIPSLPATAGALSLSPAAMATPTAIAVTAVPILPTAASAPAAASRGTIPGVLDATSSQAQAPLVQARPAIPKPAPKALVSPEGPSTESTAAPALLRSQAPRRLQDAWLALGQGDSQRALILYRQVLAERPDDADATLGLAVALHRQKQLQEAWTAYQRSLQLWPDNATARTGMLSILSESDALTAESRLQDWIYTRPRDAAAQAALGHLLGRQGRWAEAVSMLERAQSLAPEQAAYAYNLAVALDQVRRYADAMRSYRLALQLGGTAIPVRSIEHRIEQLQELTVP